MDNNTNQLNHNTNQAHSKKEAHWLKLLLNEVGNHVLSIIFIIVLYLLLWVVPQINDLIVVIVQADNDWIAVLAFFSSLSVLAFLISTVNTYFEPHRNSKLNKLQTQSKKPKVFYIPKDNKEIFIESNDSDFKETKAEYIKRIFPKLLGTFVIIIAAYAVNNTFREVYGKNVSFSGGDLGLLAIIVILIMSLYEPLTKAVIGWFGKFKWTQYIPISLTVLSLLGILVLGVFNQGGSKGDSVRLFYSLILLAILFLLLSISYNKIVLKLKKYFGGPLIVFLVFGIFITYLVLVYNPQALKIITPLSIVMICVVGIYTLLNIIKFIGFKSNMPWLTITILAAIVLAKWTASKEDFSHYDASSTDLKIKPADRLSLERYVEQWVSDRKVDIQTATKEKKFPIILVSAEGGGSRAGLWSFLVQSYLYNRNSEYFEKYMFSATGASGGGVGNNMFYTQVYNLQNSKSKVPLKYETLQEDKLKYRASKIYSEDYLSTSVASIMGRDLFKSITNLFTFKDRGALLEKEWEDSFKSTFEYENESPLAETYLDIMPKLNATDYIIPLLVTNTTHLQSGEYAVISPVCTLEDKNNMNVFEDILAVYPSDSKMIKRSTAMSLNARFPYVSPAARIKHIGQFGDAGYYDNIGGTVTRRLKKALVKVLEKDTTLNGKYEVKHLLITNYEGHKKIEYASQLTAPGSIIWNATFTHPKEMVKSFINTYNVQSKRTCIARDTMEFTFMKRFQDANEQILPVIPLGRYLSESAIRSLEARLEHPEVTKLLDSLIPLKTN